MRHLTKYIGAFDHMDWRIRQNGLAHSPKWTSACMIHHTCVYIRVGWGLLRRGPRGSQPPGKGPEPQKPPARTNIYTCIVYHACAGPFWRMRQSILANAPVHFIECACLFWRMSYFIQCFSVILMISLVCYYCFLSLYFLYVEGHNV